MLIEYRFYHCFRNVMLILCHSDIDVVIISMLNLVAYIAVYQYINHRDIASQGHILCKLRYISLEEVKIVYFQQ